MGAAQPEPHRQSRKLALARRVQVFHALPSSRRKYLVEIHAHDQHLHTADFYAKVSNVSRYRMRTNQQPAGEPGGTVPTILAQVIRQDP